MIKYIQRLLLLVVIAAATAGAAGAHTQAPAGALAQAATSAQAQAPASAQAQATSSSPDGRWKVTLYPILVWVPLGIDVNVNVPPVEGGGGGGGGSIVNSQLDGAFLGGFAIAHRFWRIDVDGLWASFGGDRPENPKLTVDVSGVYGHVSGGVKVYKDLYVTGGVRRYALKYDVKLGDYPNFERKPGVWDPLVGVAWRYIGKKLEAHATFDGGGFGVGADVDVAAAFHLDWKPVHFFGLTGGYQVLYIKASDTLASKTFTFKQTLHGPIAGIGFYF
jgi:hypothetical protein